MREADRQTLIKGAGLATEPGRNPNRGVTLLSAEVWRAVCDSLGRDLPWHTRRANVLVEGLDLASSIGQVLELGPARIHIHGETRPCALMDRACEGLRAALTGGCKGGVHGEVLSGGEVAVGDRAAFTTPA
jgi:MOSC domain-containing protein YiiM